MTFSFGKVNIKELAQQCGRSRSFMGDILVGTSISHYKVTEKIGEGGMGKVYCAKPRLSVHSVTRSFTVE